MGRSEIAELDQILSVALQIVRVRAAAQHLVDDSGHLCPGDAVVGLEGAVRITGGDSGRVQVIHIGGSPIVFGV